MDHRTSHNLHIPLYKNHGEREEVATVAATREGSGMCVVVVRNGLLVVKRLEARKNTTS
jgi:hypothetical protein